MLLGLAPTGVFGQRGGAGQERFNDAELEGELEFLNEGPVEMDTAFGEELDGRLYTSLDRLNGSDLLIPAERFYLRTRASRLLPPEHTWKIAVGGMVAAPLKLGIAELRAKAKPLGLHLMECSGNTRAAHFGMISVGEWVGIPMNEIVTDAKVKTSATQILVSGFDRYAGNSVSSTPGASWILNWMSCGRRRRLWRQS